MNTKHQATLGKLEIIFKNKNYADTTIKMYLFYIHQFLKTQEKSPIHINKKEISDYLLSYKYSSISQQNQVISSLKLFTKYILKIKKFHIDGIERPRKEHHLPQIIDKNMLAEKIENIKNIKHRAIIQLAYCCALRVSEVINLKITDIDSKRMLIHIRNSKGNKSRFVPISDSTIKILRMYFKQYKPNNYLFNGQFDDRYSPTSCNNIVKKYLDNNYHFHLLRHSGLTHMLENGTDIRILQVIAGHKKPETTSIYCHVSLNLLNLVNLPI